MSDKLLTSEQKRNHVLYLREQAREAKAYHQHLNQLRNRFMTGTSTREDIFLALNTAATNMLIFSQTSNNLADIIVANFPDIEAKGKPMPRQQQLPTLQKTDKAENLQKDLQEIRHMLEELGILANQFEPKPRVAKIPRRSTDGNTHRVRHQKNTVPALRLIVGGKGPQRE